MKLVECYEEFGLDRCAKIHIKAFRFTEEAYKRDCQTASACEAPSCKASSEDNCEVYCCTGDYCNKSSTRIVSSTIVFTCSMLVYLLMQLL